MGRPILFTLHFIGLLQGANAELQGEAGCFFEPQLLPAEEGQVRTIVIRAEFRH